MEWFNEVRFAITRALSKDTMTYDNPMEELIYEAKKWIGVHEKKGRTSKSVDVFRKATNGKAEGEAWCAAFVQYCCIAVSSRGGKEIAIPPSELCSHIWEHTPKQYKLHKPVPGCLIVWSYPDTIFGHIGIVEEIGEAGKILWTIEGNTKPPQEVASESGTGVYRRMRTNLSSEEMVLLGYLKPFK